VRSQALNDVVVDREGSIYVIEGKFCYKGRQLRTWPPPFLAPEEVKKSEGEVHVNRRKSLMQRLLKFSPEGGVLDGDGGRAQLWHHPGVSGVSPLKGWGHLQPGHMCLDPDERIWIPDTYNYCIKAVDRAGNLILRVGKYGNEECRGGGGDRKREGTHIVVDPEVPLARPHGMAVADGRLFIAKGDRPRRGLSLYQSRPTGGQSPSGTVPSDRLFIADMMSHRVVRCRLEYAETRIIEVTP